MGRGCPDAMVLISSFVKASKATQAAQPPTAQQPYIRGVISIGVRSQEAKKVEPPHIAISVASPTRRNKNPPIFHPSHDWGTIVQNCPQTSGQFLNSSTSHLPNMSSCIVFGNPSGRRAPGGAASQWTCPCAPTGSDGGFWVLATHLHACLPSPASNASALYPFLGPSPIQRFRSLNSPPLSSLMPGPCRPRRMRTDAWMNSFVLRRGGAVEDCAPVRGSTWRYWPGVRTLWSPARTNKGELWVVSMLPVSWWLDGLPLSTRANSGRRWCHPNAMGIYGREGWGSHQTTNF
jgi:hypothetical protein